MRKLSAAYGARLSLKGWLRSPVGGGVKYGDTAIEKTNQKEVRDKLA